MQLICSFRSRVADSEIEKAEIRQHFIQYFIIEILYFEILLRFQIFKCQKFVWYVCHRAVEPAMLCCCCERLVQGCALTQGRAEMLPFCAEQDLRGPGRGRGSVRCWSWSGWRRPAVRGTPPCRPACGRESNNSLPHSVAAADTEIYTSSIASLASTTDVIHLAPVAGILLLLQRCSGSFAFASLTSAFSELNLQYFCVIIGFQACQDGILRVIAPPQARPSPVLHLNVAAAPKP